MTDSDVYVLPTEDVERVDAAALAESHGDQSNGVVISARQRNGAGKSKSAKPASAPKAKRTRTKTHETPAPAPRACVTADHAAGAAAWSSG